MSTHELLTVMAIMGIISALFFVAIVELMR
jgi:hypothetical protein